MASQVVSAAKRLRVSLLLDIYGELLTEKQRTFLQLYYEEDMSFGEIAKEFGVSRQAIFDSVRHGEETLEHFESVLRLVETGWSPTGGKESQAVNVASSLAKLRDKVSRNDHFPDKPMVLRELDGCINILRHHPVNQD